MLDSTTDKLSVGNIIARASSPTPPFWAKVRNIALLIASVAGGVVFIGTTGGVALPAAMLSIAKAVGALATYSAAQAQITTTNQPAAPAAPAAESEATHVTDPAAQ